MSLYAERVALRGVHKLQEGKKRGVLEGGLNLAESLPAMGEPIVTRETNKGSHCSPIEWAIAHKRLSKRKPIEWEAINKEGESATNLSNGKFCQT